MKMKTYNPKDLYIVKAGREKLVIKCNDADKLEELVKNNLIDEWKPLNAFKID
jgi:hypothetical protein